jgi:nucleoside-diphosphate kinase
LPELIASWKYFLNDLHRLQESISKKCGAGKRLRPVVKIRIAVARLNQKRAIMATERTLSIIKPDATQRNLTGKINARFEEKGLRIIAQKRMRLSRLQAGLFYAVHKERPFFGELVEYMVSSPVVVQVLEGENAVAHHREVMGATNPANAAPGTIRHEFAESIERNSVHGSDSLENAGKEIRFFFSDIEIVG